MGGAGKWGRRVNVGDSRAGGRRRAGRLGLGKGGGRRRKRWGALWAALRSGPESLCNREMQEFGQGGIWFSPGQTCLLLPPV